MFYDVYHQLCAERGKAESTVCRELGIAPNSPKYWKEGQEPRPSTIKKVADYFGVDVSYFEKKEELKMIPVHVITQEEQQILVMLSNLTEERRELVFNLIRELSK